MKKSIIAFTAISLLAGNLAFANTHANTPKHSPEFHKAMGECLAEAGIKKPEFNKDNKPAKSQNGERPEPPKNNDERPKPPKDAQGNQAHPRGKHPKLEMSDAQRSQVDACLTKKGFEKPQKRTSS